MSEQARRKSSHQVRLGAVEAIAGYALIAPLAYLVYYDISQIAQMGWIGVAIVFAALILIWDGMGRFNSGWSIND